MKLILDAASPLLIMIPVVVVLLILAVLGIGIYALVKYLKKHGKGK